MKMRLLALAGVLSLATASFAQGWADNFDTYANGTNLHNVGGWVGWDNTAGATGFVSNAQAHSGANSVAITNTSDLTRPYTTVNGGYWRYRTRVYIPSSAGSTGFTYFILLNNYNPASPTTHSWSAQLKFDLAANTVDDDLYNPTQPPIFPAQPYNRDAWNSIVCDADMVNNATFQYINGLPLTDDGTFVRQWRPDVTADPNALDSLQGVDLYGDTIGGTCYYDTMSVNHVMAAEAYNITSGTFFGGDLASLQGSDDNVLFILNEESAPNTQVVMTSNETIITGTLSYLQITGEFASTRSDLSVSLRAKNWNTNQFVAVGAPVTSTTTDQFLTVSTTNASNFKSVGGVIETALYAFPQEDLIAEDGWQVNIDWWQIETR